MSGGMDIDWGFRERQLQRAVKEFGNKSKKELETLAEALCAELLAIEKSQQALYEEQATTQRKLDYIWALHRATPHELQDAQDAISKETT